jgi:MSHA biogenesis protein MshI
MNWLKPRPRIRSHAVLSPNHDGIVALQVRDEGERASVLTCLRSPPIAITAAALREIAGEAGIKAVPLIALLGQDAYQTVMVEAPSVPEDEIRSAIRWKVKDLLGFHIDDAVLDHLPVPGGGGRAGSLYVVAAQAAAIRALVQPFHEADLPLEVIDIRETAQHNIAMRIAPADYAVAVLHFDGENSLLTFSFGDHLIMSRRIEGRGMSGEPLLDKVAMETQRSVDYFERQYSWLPLARLYLAPTTQAQALLRRLGEYLPIGAENLELARVFDFGGQAELQSATQQNAVFHALGACLRQS